MTSRIKLSSIGLLLLASLILGGCGGGPSTQVQSTTKGQELLDLDEAKKRGLITEKEYKKQKKKILKR